MGLFVKRKMAGISGTFEYLWKAGCCIDRRDLFEQVVVVNGMMVGDIAKFGMIRPHKFENNPIGLIHSEAPDFVLLGMQFFGSERGMEGVAFEQPCFFGCLTLNRSW